MKVGIPKEILDQEYRVAITPSGVNDLVSAGHKVFLEKDAGLGSGFLDENYIQAGATIVNTPQDVFASSQLILKVKQPLAVECNYLTNEHILFTYLHLAADKKLAELLCKSKATCIAYETIEKSNGQLPLLIPMSEIAGRMSIQIGARQLEKYYGGSGVLLGGVPGVESANVLIIGGGTVGFNAARMALGLNANVTIFDKSLERLRDIDNIFAGNVQTLYSARHKIEEVIVNSDLVITATLTTGAKAPKLISSNLLKSMRANSAIVDVAIDQGGCVEGIKPTKHSDPIIRINDVNLYAVPNIPGAVPRTSTLALTNASIPYVLKLANRGVKVFLDDPELEKGVNVHNGFITHKIVADSLSMDYEQLK